jgi:hypothetical protein
VLHALNLSRPARKTSPLSNQICGGSSTVFDRKKFLMNVL